MTDFILENKKFIYILSISILITIISIVLCFVFYFKYHDNNKNEDPLVLETNENIEEDISKKMFYIEVKGAVVNPDVYEVTEGQIIKDAINIAGGFLDNAYTDNINLSKVLENEMVIYVFTKEMYENSKTNNNENNNICEVCDCDKYIVEPDINNSVVTPSESDAPVNNESPNSLININTATTSELMLLPGIGEAKAQNIIAYRTENGNFLSIEDIKNVSGIGEVLYEQIKELITVS